MGSKYLAYGIQFLSLAVLARLFSPETFGLIAAVQVFYVFFQLVADGGLSPAVISLRGMTPRSRDGIFGLSILVGLALGLLFFLLGPALATFYELPSVKNAAGYIAVGLAFNAANILPAALLQRQQSFFSLAVSAIVAECVALLVVIIARSQTDPLTALSLRLPVVAGTMFLCNYVFSKNTDFGRPVPGHHFAAIRPLLRTSMYQLAFNTVNFFSRNLDSILVGKYLGASALGIYDRSYQLMRYPLQLLSFAMAPAIQPVLREHASDTALINRVHQDLALKLSIAGAVLSAVMYLFADWIVVVLFGQGWSAAIPVIKILALTIPVQVILSTSGSFFQTFSRTDLLFVCGLISAIVNVVAISIGVAMGNLEALCWALLISFNLNFFIVYFVLYRYIFKTGYLKFLARYIPAMLVTGLLVVWHLLYA